MESYAINKKAASDNSEAALILFYWDISEFAIS